MKPTLYHYVHCPFCVRIRLALGLLNIDFNSIVLPYSDEKTPIKLSGKKMLPILKHVNGRVQNESLDIIKDLDETGVLNYSFLKKHNDEIENLLSKLGKDIHSLCMPYWIWTKEFDSESREYFQKKKETKRGPFNKLILNKNAFLNSLKENLDVFEKDLISFYKSENLTIVDIMIASHLWGMYIFPEFQFSAKIHSYLQRISNECHFDYHQDFWANT